MLDLDQVRNRYLKYFADRNHRVIPSAPLIPENDPTTLFTGSGMQPIIPYLLGQEHPLGSRLTNSQKCFRAEDIDEVGDNRHTTFFEMLGNWSLGDYFKEEQLPWFFEFLTDDLGIDPSRLYVSVFAGDESLSLPRDTEAVALWKKLFTARSVSALDVDMGSLENASALGMRGGRIFFYDAKKNWWSRSGPPSAMPNGEIGGPDSEVFYDFGTPHKTEFGAHCHPNCDCGRFVEIGNSVFMQYRKNEAGVFEKLPKSNVDFGGGLERISAAANKEPDIFKLDVFKHIVTVIEQLTGIQYDTGTDEQRKSFRVIADHIRASIFMLSDGVLPSNKERGYILRRLLRRVFFKLNRLGSRSTAWVPAVVEILSESYGTFYPELEACAPTSISAIQEEAEKFFTTIEAGQRILEKELAASSITGERLFDFHQSYGFPLELSLEVLQEKGVLVSPEMSARLKSEFLAAQNIHKDASRTASDKKFKGGMGDASDMSIRYHTATHLLHMALRKVLGEHVSQKGSNITPERLRFDFTHTGKMTDEQKKEVERIVNEVIAAKLPVNRVVLPKAEAEATGALHFFAEKYGDSISVYFIGDSLKKAVSKEFCGGPHVLNTAELGGVFRIAKEEAVSSGVRRIKAVIES